jgi:hypothetical protein
MGDEGRDVLAFACCSVGIGRWFWVAWGSEADARHMAPALASGYEKSADRAEQKAVERLGAGARRLPAKWASGYLRGGGTAPGADKDSEGKPKARFRRPIGRPKRDDESPRLAFLYSAVGREPLDPSGHVIVTRHRIVKQSPRKIHVECDPFDEDAWESRAGGDADRLAEPRTLAVDRFALRKDGRFQAGCAHGGRTFYASEEAGIRDVEATLTAKYPWCAVLGVRLPCTIDRVKEAYRRLAFASHPDRGGDPAEFRSVEEAYRAALAYLARIDEATA